jgi:isoaspartyl peptidase/L-asparaginase-like protein (Ntn-hydrolase superfamily)
MTVVYVHGGVSGTVKQTRPSLAHAMNAAQVAASALDAVESAVRAMEDDPKLNAGYGAVLNRDGVVELEAGVVDGSTRCWAGVANVAIDHPISLARRVLENTPHVFLAGEGAQALASSLGFETLEDTTPEQNERWKRAKSQGELAPGRFGRAEHVDTVGAVALDDSGRLGAASSTGGILGKLPGRVGDSPIFGAGIYASHDVAVVGTGVGELFLQALACLRVGQLVEEGSTPQRACEEVVSYLLTLEDTSAGLLALDSSGRVGAAFRGATWAVEGPHGVLEAARI